MSYMDALRALADAYNVAWWYQDSADQRVEVSEDTLLKTLRSLGVRFGNEPQESLEGELPVHAENPSFEALEAALQQRQDELFARPLPPCVVATEGYPYVVHVHVHDGASATMSITLEDGQVREPAQVENWTQPREIDGVRWGEASFELPGDLPLGWHTLTLESDNLTASCFLIVTPHRINTADAFLEQPAAGVMAQLYSVRSNNSWGMGDFSDLGALAHTVAQDDFDFLLINPLHAAEPFPPTEDSPYLPTSRRFTHPLYIDIAAIPELLLLDDDTRSEIDAIAADFQQRNHSGEQIQRNDTYATKLQVLREIFAAGRDQAREQDFRDFIAGEGEGLHNFAQWCAAQEISELGVDGHHAIEPDVDELAEFYMWLQWICDQQLAAAQSAATDAGMRIGIMADLAVGIHPGGADAQNLRETLVQKASVGAPPDAYNQQGQDWAQPPWHPERLAEAGYIPWRDLLRTVLRHSGGIRIDHILGLFRLFWIPRGQSPSTGTYVRYDHEALIGILALEAQRAGAIVIGEDLGTFEPWVQEYLAERGVMGTTIVWFEHDWEDKPLRQEHYRQLALTSVNTHDLPPTAGYLQGEHIDLRERLGLLESDVEEEHAADLQWQADVLERVAEQGGFPEGKPVEHFHGVAREERGSVDQLIPALCRFIAHTPSVLTCVSLVDMTGDVRAQNQPGTTKDQYPNWCIPLCDGEGTPVLIEQLRELDLYKRVAEASKRG
ncbi:4-alpha-glucanotransferase [Corynebacterium gerontici]|uniref:4-alpha-glucanotransferase n=1 Tax=Corynebacterium gerontici TaxID=2079234 RepID=UPI0013DE179D|nr:4-alpha-glucanotransferase [Corynebacterium gerontici]